MDPAEVLDAMTREEMIRFLESWAFKCDADDTNDELAEAVAHNCDLENIDLQQLLRLREVLNIAFSGSIQHVSTV